MTALMHWIYNGAMTNHKTKAVVLAAGRSKRMKSARSKVVTPILGKPVLMHLLDALAGAGIAAEDTILIVSPDHDDIKRIVRRPVLYAVQDPPLGTAHALKSAMPLLTGFNGQLLVTVGDNPYIQAEDFRDLIQAHRALPVACTLLSAIFPFAPPAYGRLIRNASGDVARIVEELDASPQEKEVREVNASIYLFDYLQLVARIDQIGNANKKGEYYLTDIISILNGERQRVRAVVARDYRVSIGVNTKWELAEAIAYLNQANMKKLAEENGVLFVQPESTTVEMDVVIGADSIIHPCTVLTGGVRIGARCQVGPFVHLNGGVVDDDQIVTSTSPGGR